MSDALLACHFAQPSHFAPDALECTRQEGALSWRRGGQCLAAAYAPDPAPTRARLQACRRFNICIDIVLDVLTAGPGDGAVAAAIDAAIRHVEPQLCDRDRALLLTDGGAPAGALMQQPPSPAVQTLKPFQISAASDQPCSAPAAAYLPAAPGSTAHHVPVHVDVLAIVDAAVDRERALDILFGGVRRQLAYVGAVLTSAHSTRGALPAGVTCCHYRLPGFGCPVTVAYPLHAPSCTTRDEADASKLRLQLHGTFGLPPDRPYLRLANACTPDGDLCPGAAGKQGQLLRNVHECLGAPPVKNASLHMLQGSYHYHHYMQDNFNDSGWGCAYRSLQTIWSWFVLQGYTNAAVPSHRDIQMTLAKLGDKPPSFVGSKQWVGAVELGMVLQELLGLDYRILTVSKGSEVPSLASDIAAHFRSEGTPIMVGGGVLAYTLLGIAWNEDSGEVAFLILDPHYTGGENVDKIKGGTWVGWKRLGESAAAGGPLFAPNAFYNLMCPQRPRGV